jgi:hypothetical protein
MSLELIAYNGNVTTRLFFGPVISSSAKGVLPSTTLDTSPFIYEMTGGGLITLGGYVSIPAGTYKLSKLSHRMFQVF